MQGPSIVAARLAGGGLTMPVLVAPDGVLGESEDILRYADRTLPEDARLFSGDAAVLADAEALSRRLNTELGPRTRRIAYARLISAKGLLLKMNNQGSRPGRRGCCAPPGRWRRGGSRSVSA